MKSIFFPIKYEPWVSMQIAALNQQAASLTTVGGNASTVRNLLAQVRCLQRGWQFNPNHPDFVSEVEALLGEAVPDHISL